MKIAVITLSLLIILSILPILSPAFAAPTISIETSKSVYEYGDHLVMIINVSDIIEDDIRIYITDPAERKSLLLQSPIYQEYTEFPSKFPFDSAIWKPGTYVLELEYSGADCTHVDETHCLLESSVQFTIEDTGKVGLPYWIRDLAKMWINEPTVTDKDFARALEYLIEHGIIKIPYTEPGEETVSSIPEWIKNNAGWWVEGKISDTEFTMALQYLVKTGIITVNFSKV
jgi:hypothetical protein